MFADLKDHLSEGTMWAGEEASRKLTEMYNVLSQHVQDAKHEVAKVLADSRCGGTWTVSSRLPLSRSQATGLVTVAAYLEYRVDIEGITTQLASERKKAKKKAICCHEGCSLLASS